MKIRETNVVLSALFVAATIVTCGVVATLSEAQTQQSPKPSTAAASAPVPSGQAFATPKEAADALIQAASNFDVPALLKILGTGANDIVASEDTVQDKKRALEFAAKAKEKESWSRTPKTRPWSPLPSATTIGRCPSRLSKAKTGSGTSTTKPDTTRYCVGASVRTNST